jgi:RNA recognition motif-containing protein
MSSEELQAKELKRLKRKRYQQNKKSKWFDNKINTFIYVKGLPKDVTTEEISKYFVKCGSLKIDP